MTRAQIIRAVQEIAGIGLVLGIVALAFVWGLA